MNATGSEDNNPGKFELTTQHNVYFVPTLVDGEAPVKTQMAIGSLVPRSVWESNPAVMIVAWAVKWAANGLSPMRPLVVAMADIVLPPGRALALHV